MPKLWVDDNRNRKARQRNSKGARRCEYTQQKPPCPRNALTIAAIKSSQLAATPPPQMEQAEPAPASGIRFHREFVLALDTTAQEFGLSQDRDGTGRHGRASVKDGQAIRARQSNGGDIMAWHVEREMEVAASLRASRGQRMHVRGAATLFPAYPSNKA
ncbi:hypothetical protein E4U31_000570 [Claviceps sp. LM219 group G6]|nr:hypothetical protein E4U15_002474 [Claviceps sp. LM218 group G6]KAG6106813.1 hypothetical protein E4U31_000570 [Claviceps sp. LM219 group G6]